MAKVTINGKSYEGKYSVVLSNGKIIIDGKEVEDADLPKTILGIEVTGGLLSLTSDVSVNCDDVAGDVHAGGSVNCDDVKGSVTAAGSVNCDEVGGDVTAGGSIVHS